MDAMTVNRANKPHRKLMDNIKLLCIAGYSGKCGIEVNFVFLRTCSMKKASQVNSVQATIRNPCDLPPKTGTLTMRVSGG
jgi:hypothetical protein